MNSFIFNNYGNRKYLTASEIELFIKAARRCSIDVRTFCLILAFTGCRISEALSLTAESIDFVSEQVIIKSLKKRGKKIFRAVPLPPDVMKIFKTWLARRPASTNLLWPWCRMTGYRRIRDVMILAGISGGHATPKGLRHGFGVKAIQSGIPLTLVQRWLGHADIKTTAIYTSAMGPEERQLAARMWGKHARVRKAVRQAEPCLEPA